METMNVAKEAITTAVKSDNKAVMIGACGAIVGTAAVYGGKKAVELIKELIHNRKAKKAEAEGASETEVETEE